MSWNPLQRTGNGREPPISVMILATQGGRCTYICTDKFGTMTEKEKIKVMDSIIAWLSMTSAKVELERNEDLAQSAKDAMAEIVDLFEKNVEIENKIGKPIAAILLGMSDGRCTVCCTDEFTVMTNQQKVEVVNGFIAWFSMMGGLVGHDVKKDDCDCDNCNCDDDYDDDYKDCDE